MTTRISAPIKIIAVPNDDMDTEEFVAMAQGTVAVVDFIDHRGRLLTGKYVRSGLHRDGLRLVVTVARPSEWFPDKDIIDSGVVSVGYGQRTTFHVPADHPLAIHYLGETWCRERAEDGSCIHSDCEFR